MENKPSPDVVPQFVGGVLLSDEEQKKIWEWLPYRHQIKEAHLIYNGQKDGYNLHTLYRMSECELKKREHKRGVENPSVLVIKTGKKEIIGAYTSDAWHRTDHYFGAYPPASI